VVAYTLSFVAAWRLPESHHPALTERAPLPVRRLLRDRGLVCVFFATVAGWCAYSAFELLTPIPLTQTHGVAPATWGVLFALNPVVIVALQLRVTRLASRVRRSTRLGAGVVLMAMPYVLLEASSAIAVIAAVLLVVVLGEMLWAPASEALVASMAPPGWRGVYLGSANAASWLGMALAPAAGLQARAAFGDTAMWLFVAAIGAVGAVLYLVASRPLERSLQQSERDRPPFGHADEADARDASGDGDGRGRRRAEAGRSDRQPARAAGC
jgi:predicted MFS family arabinose efflux permease